VSDAVASYSELFDLRCPVIPIRFRGSPPRVDSRKWSSSPVIESFSDKPSAKVFAGESSTKLPGDIQARAKMKLTTLHLATELEHLAFPTGNDLEALSGDLRGFHSIHINRQWRIIFRWEGGNAYEVQIFDYH
jgi:proteic killer suppression protein